MTSQIDTTQDYALTISLDIHQFIQEEKQLLSSASYETGLLGYSLFYALLSRYTKEKSFLLLSERYCIQALDKLNNRDYERLYATDTLDSQIAHTGRFLIFARKNDLFDLDTKDYLLSLDHALAQLAPSKIEMGDFDPISGALAAGFYFLERAKDLENSLAHSVLEQIVTGLRTKSKKTKNGSVYWSSPALHDRVYLGISHGSASIISFLCRVHALDIQRKATTILLRKAVDFLLNQYRISPYKGLFANMIGDEIDHMQFSLCYGDAGTALALLRASKILNNHEKLIEITEHVLEDCLTRTYEDGLTLDASVYYGAVGLAITFEQIHLISKDDRYLSRAKYWTNQVHNYQDTESRFVGFTSRLDKESFLWNISFGWGILGIGSTLLAMDNHFMPSLAELTYAA